MHKVANAAGEFYWEKPAAKKPTGHEEHKMSKAFCFFAGQFIFPKWAKLLKYKTAICQPGIRKIPGCLL
ncbi:MAG: hypothetical protein SFX18_16975 [Pirellulales bacterium]|nr:hypothetical protein [Pirellulales bacterium]